jgi:hypothetical protein
MNGLLRNKICRRFLGGKLWLERLQGNKQRKVKKENGKNDDYSLVFYEYRCRLRSFASIAKNINPCQFEDENVRMKGWTGPHLED